MKKNFTCTLLLLASLLISSCALTIKPAATKSAKSYYESFFVGEGGTQYFIKPIEFKSENSQNKLFFDLTFRYKNELKDSATINFSIESDYIVKEVNDIAFTNATSTVFSDGISLLFNEKKGQKFTSRFSAQCSTKEIIDLFNDSAIKININTNNTSLSFLPDKNAQKIIRSLNNNLYILFR